MLRGVTSLAPDLDRTAKWAAYFAGTWAVTAPVRIHSATIAPGGALEWSADFAAWMTREEGRASERKPEDTQRTLRVMRRLRRVSVREYEVLYRMLVLHEDLPGTTAWLNERAVTNAIPLPDGREVHYRHKDTMALLVCGIEFALHHW
jgi:hypothetical protein